MARKRFTPEQVITMLREVEVLLSLCDKGKRDGMIIRKWTEKSPEIGTNPRAGPR